MTQRALPLVLAVLTVLSCAPSAQSPIEVVTLPSPDSPLVAIRLMFRVGSIHDPAGKEGLSALTALMVGEAGSEAREYSELIDALYPMAASIQVSSDREVTVIRGEVHREKLAEYVDLLKEVLLSPGLREKDFTRNRNQLETYLTNTLRASNDELLGLETLQQAIFAGHPYGHAPQGSVSSLQAITLDDVRAFYNENYTQSNLMLGVAGGYPDGFVEELVEALSALPRGEAGLLPLPEPPGVEGRDFLVVDKRTNSVGIHFGYPLPITRADDDYYPLMVANSYLGEHRTFFGRLMTELRGKRGLNYGDYSYIEYWHLPPFTSNPSPSYPRRQQYFSVWVRPVVPDTAHFALRNAIYEVDRLVERGLTEEEFALTRDYLVNYSKLWARTLSNRLGFLMDSRFYGMDYYIDEIESRLSGLTVEQVNAAVRKYLSTDSFQGVFVTDRAADVVAYLKADEPSPMTYNSPPEAEVVEADKTIEKLPVSVDDTRIIPVDQMFADGGLPAPESAGSETATE
ncbi:MAG: pitrilysin family protein [Thermoanaerobaculia bacterium]|nr:pitrilysin family protein [Thermoanaerobaculia bacterium]